MLSCKFCKVFKNTFSQITPPSGCFCFLCSQRGSNPFSSNKLVFVIFPEFNKSESLKDAIFDLFDSHCLYVLLSAWLVHQILSFAHCRTNVIISKFGPSSAILRRLSKRISVSLDQQLVFICVSFKDILSNLAFATTIMNRSSTKVKTSDQALHFRGLKYITPNLLISGC